MKDGGPAFPTHDKYVTIMSLRAWFAGQALVGILAHPMRPNTHGNASEAWCERTVYPPMEAARMAVEYADRLLAELQKAQR